MTNTMRIVLVVIGAFFIGVVFLVNFFPQLQFGARRQAPPTVINSAVGLSATSTAQTSSSTYATMLIAGGCFWCVQADIEKLPGVIDSVAGYAGGTASNPTYETYAADGDREVVEVHYNPHVVTFRQVLIYAMKHMDPTDGGGSFYDRGPQYSPAFYYSTPDEEATIHALIATVNANGPYGVPLAIAVEPTPTFWPAEAYHQDYYKGALTALKYEYYRKASGRDAFIAKYWGTNSGPTLPWEMSTSTALNHPWDNYVKPADAILKTQLTALQYSVTQQGGTEPSGSSPLDKNFAPGIYVDILSGQPLYSSKDKFESGTGWPSFVKPITPSAVTEYTDWSFFIKRTEIRASSDGDHLGHVFTDGPVDRGGLRYCMNGAALRFIPESQMVQAGYGDYLQYL